MIIQSWKALMSFVTLKSTDLPAEERFDWWCDLISRDVAPTRITSDHVADFRATAGAIDLSAVQLTTMSFPALKSVRTPALIRRSDPEAYELTLIVGGEMWISQNGDDTQMGVGDLVMWQTSRPYDGGAFDGPRQAQAIIVHLPRADLPLPAGKVDGLLSRRMPATGGLGAILATYLKTLVREAPAMAPQDARRLGASTLDLAMAFLAQSLDAQRYLPPETRDQTLMAQIRTFVEHNLADAQLSPGAVAARHHISVRHLQVLFQRQGTTLTEWIRRRRLEHCRTDLADPRLRTLSIRAIATRWGFPRAADFSRSFRAVYGMPPRDYRHSVMGPRGQGAAPGA
ncbi:helix-turn-helix domain-containing protein [Streptosporangium sp. CA-135522]|uniref:AraC-like ligand-binding domain-containing protein n=1 Tax=Streptosporangium sp. CA-135522 TaxID=3240072 RepID=UPI003D925040